MFGFYAGLDLGQQQDFTALSVIEPQYYLGAKLAAAFGVGSPHDYQPGWISPTDPRFTRSQMARLYNSNEPMPSKPPMHVRHLQRFDLGTPYPRIVTEVTRLLMRRQIKDRGFALVIDATGVGLAVVDLFREAGLRPVAVTITGGQRAHRDGQSWNVPKRDLVGSAQAALQSDRLKIAASLPEAQTLRDELRSFKVKINERTGHDSYSAWRERDHDDQVLAVAMACWYRDRYMRRHDAARTMHTSRVTRIEQERPLSRVERLLGRH
ncbi:hypothetical protein BH23CHL2_BH23CHL2_25020 [soil metagenome]